MNVPRWLAPKTNPALYTALASIALSVWQAIQVDFWRGSLTLAEVGRVAAPIVIAYLSYGFQRGKTTPLADPKDSNGNPLGLLQSTLSDAERRRAEDMRPTHAPGTPSFYPYPGETPAPPGTQTVGHQPTVLNVPPAKPPASTP